MEVVDRRQFLKDAGASAAGLAAATLLRAEGIAAAQRPNIILILADDYGIDGAGCYGSDAFAKLTPRIDALAKGGMRFETCYAAPLCGPTRCLLNTGRYAFRTGGLTNDSWRGDGLGAKCADEYPIARLLREAGYATCCSGKWRQVGETPGDWGYDEWVTDGTAGGWYWEKKYTRNGAEVVLEAERYLPDVYHEAAVDFIRRQKTKPYFLYYPTHLVHGPIQRTPDSRPETKEYYADNVAYLDKLVGKLVDEVASLGQAGNTLILFSGDNGTAKKSGSIGGREVFGAKGSLLEGGARVPLLAYWPGRIEAGRVNGDLVDFSDFYPTLAELAAVPVPKSLPMDGHSFAGPLQGKTGNPRDWVFVQLGSKWYVREKRWKLNQDGELFDLKDQPFAELAVAAESADPEAHAARKRLQAALDGLNPGGGKLAPPGEKAGKKKRRNQTSNG